VAVETNEHLGFFAHELRNFLGTATLAFTAAKVGNLNLSGATGAVFERSLVGLRNLIDSSLAEIRMTAGNSARPHIFSLADFIAEIKSAADLAARMHGCTLTVSTVDIQLAINAGRDLLSSALGNLLQNTFKFTHPDSEVTLNAYAIEDRILIDVKRPLWWPPTWERRKNVLTFYADR
jgi:signal transduction histidine kinase